MSCCSKKQQHLTVLYLARSCCYVTSAIYIFFQIVFSHAAAVLSLSPQWAWQLFPAITPTHSSAAKEMEQERFYVLCEVNDKPICTGLRKYGNAAAV